MGRDILRWISKEFEKANVAGIVGAMISAILQYLDRSIENPVLFFIITLASAGIGIVAGKWVSVFFLWVSKKFNYLHVKLINVNSKLLALDVTSKYTENIDDFKVSLKRVVVFGFQDEFIVPHENGFTETQNFSNGKITPNQDNARVLIARLHPENRKYVDILVKGGFLNDGAYNFGENSVAVYEVVFEITGRVQDENISRWYRARFRFDEQREGVVKPIRSIAWMKMEKYSKKKYEDFKLDFSEFTNDVIPTLYNFGGK